jgi:hypothetical protein
MTLTKSTPKSTSCPLLLLRQIERTHAGAGLRNQDLDAQTIHNQYMKLHMHPNERLFTFYERFTKIVKALDDIGSGLSDKMIVLGFLGKLFSEFVQAKQDVNDRSRHGETFPDNA